MDNVALNASNYGLANFWNQGDLVSHLVIIVLLTMSIISWTQIILKTISASRRKKISIALDNFWENKTLDNASKALEEKFGSNNSFVSLSSAAIIACDHLDKQKNNSIGSNLDRSEYITRVLRQSINRSTARLESGLTQLASIGAIAPFVGLFGTVYGIYHALLGISAAGNASLNAVSGPVGEALIMTAAGLFVAIPAVIAYNAFVRFNRLELMELDGFAHDLHCYLNNGIRKK